MVKSKQGKIIVLCAPSGTGKTTIKNELLRRDPTIVFSVSATTRPKRENEREGKDYYFITEDEFKAHIENNDFIEYNYHFDNYYGTLKMAVEPDLRLGCNVIVDVDVNGALAFKKLFPDQTVMIFVMPPSLEELKQRLLKRGTETEEELKIRLARVQEEMSYAKEFDHIVINDDVMRAADEILTIIRQGAA